jgi:hypothetical protein
MDEADAARAVVGMAEGDIPPMTGGAKYGTPLPPPRLRLQSRRPARGTAASVGSFVLGRSSGRFWRGRAPVSPLAVVPLPILARASEKTAGACGASFHTGVLLLNRTSNKI